MLRQAAAGAAAGVLATLTMSAVMVAGRRTGLMNEHPPKNIVRAMLPGSKHRPKPGENMLAALAHLGFGAAAGATFGAVAGRHRTSAPAGAGYGLAIWLTSYQGWLPGLDILPPISQDRPGRPAVMAAGHVVYGLTLARALRRLAP
ncbi:DUF6789 family protein [Nonomuraea endophytica]|uniref:DUF1440 domain-containing protein n=1 Tax=Nonomuraea endophytica TaxID=714136 RepID=A0A7W8ENC8_9ACTN|nr:DUF6789 family protein [Nonomuraea endophytica]MBB5085313.1 hypothetical protein [Nonomuraea endophytica]